MVEKRTRKKKAQAVDSTKIGEEVKAVVEDTTKSRELSVVDVEEIKEMSDIVEEIQNSVPQLFEKAQRNLLLNETPRYKIKKRKGKGGMMFDYVDVGYVLEQLNALTGHKWDFEVEWQTSIEEALKVNQVVVRGALKIYGKDGMVVKKVDYGNQDIKLKQSSSEFLDFGNDMKGALSDCIKRCSRQFGIALDVYSGAIKRRQDTEHPEAMITESQRRRLEVLAGEVNIGHAGLKKLINEMYDYSSTTEIQRRHFQEISVMLEQKDAGIKAVEMPDEIQQGFDILGTPKAKQIAVFNSYKAQGKLEELKKKISEKVDEKNSAPSQSTAQDKGTK